MNVGDTLPLLPVLLVLVTGAVAGVSAGLLGVGGGIIIVPALYFIFSGMPFPEGSAMHLAVGTSLATIVVTSIRSALAHNKRGSLDPQLLRQWAAPLLIGAGLGAVAASFAHWPILVGLFAVLALYVAFQLFTGREPTEAGTPTPRIWLSAALGLAVGTLSAMIGIGGGTLAVPVLSRLGYPILRAIGTSAAFGLVIALPASLGFIWGGWQITATTPFTFGYVHTMFFAVISVATLLTVPLGVKLAHTLPAQTVRRIFAVFLFVTALRMIWDVLRHVQETL